MHHYLSTLTALAAATLTTANPLLVERASCSTPDGAGTCISTSSCATSSGFSVPGHCPGATNIQCCVKDKKCSTSSGSGTCFNTQSGCSGGKFVAGACPGSADVQCCVKSGNSGGGGDSGGSPPAGSPVNQATLDLIEKLEGWRPNFYEIRGHKTIGYGHDCVAKQDCDSIKEPLSKAEGEALLAKDVKGFASCVCDLPNASELNANQYGALVSFAYNSGCGGVSRDFKSYLSKSDFDGACKALPTTNTLDGLLSGRRKQEGELCSTATSEKSGC